MSSRLLRHLWWMGLLALLYIPLACLAQSESQMASEGLAAPTGDASQLHDEKKGKTSFVVLPIPQSNPALGTGLTIAGMAFYNPNQSDRPWITGVGLMKAGSSDALGIFQQATVMDNRLRLMGALVYADLDLKFYGVGAAAGDLGISIPMEQVGAGGMFQALYKVADHWFVGGRYQNMKLTSSVDLSQLPRVGAVIPQSQLKHRIASLGPALEYDSRDDSFYPTSGTSAKVNLNFFGSGLGSDSDFRQVTASWNRYWPYSNSLVLAARVSSCAVGGDVPFTNLCMYGMSNDLRGYSTGQYRDRAMLAAQGEARWRFAPRWGAVAFAGVGAIGPSFSDLLQQKSLPSVGAGVRWQASKEYKVNVSLDVAFTQKDHAVYLYVGEAF